MNKDRAASISTLMEEAQRGDSSAADELFAALYDELHRLAKRELARQAGLISISVTTLLHEAYLDIAARSGPSFPDEARFMGYAARVMRGLIIDHARRRCAVKRGGQFEITRLGTDQTEPGGQFAEERELAPISEALDELAKADASLAELVDLKFFCGFSFAEIAAMQDISERTVQRKWEKARIYLHRTIRGSLPL